MFVWNRTVSWCWILVATIMQNVVIIKIGKHFVIHSHHNHLVQLTNTSPTNTLLMLLCTTKNEFGYILKCAYLRARPFCFLLFAMNTTKLSNPNMRKSLDWDGRIRKCFLMEYWLYWIVNMKCREAISP